ncbi:constitutive coactivator of PPAR-gamma-like protein 1 homolog isoform X3 [Echeneis naucrates]|uniref:constitutive coactivator of PPAR-gamma-like protein 1 homolog isoform X3 n=1 Tax=Echeneis naucrates TaxID=173247 RepID=UPI001113E3AD|nr:constitutive coactivator of PPAR-gamma-like protein 1 isoform X3 [Echeneis naucrates]
MGVQGFQEYIEKQCPSAVVPVELQKLARGSLVGGDRQRPPRGPLRLLVDAENCLHRLYGGFYTDWVSGGQWNHMLGYLAALSKACFSGNIELLVCFNGALEKGRLHEWVKRQVVQSIEDHHLEVIALCRENGFHGLVAYDSDYALCNVPCYFSAHALKLSRNGKSLTTSQYLMHEVARQLDLNPNRFVIFASILGNHILPDEDLAAFHWSLLGPEHPLASLKVRAHQLVLPPCDVVIKAAANYVRDIPDITDLEAIAKDVFKHSQSCTDDKVIRFKKAVAYYSLASKPTYLPAQIVIPKHMGVLAEVPSPKMINIPQVVLPVKSGHLYLDPLEAVEKDLPEQNSLSNITHEGKHTPLYERSSHINLGQAASPNHREAAFYNASSSSSSENEESSDSTANHVGDRKGRWEKHGRPSHAEIPSLLSMPTRNHMDVTIPPLPAVAPEVLRVAEHRHKNGLMYPYIYHVLTKGEIKLSVTIEDEGNKDLPTAVQLFRPIRQYVYGVLFSLAQVRKKAERLAVRKNYLPEYIHVMVKEWAACKGKSPHTPELVEALPFREWTCPNLKKLWLGKAAEDKNRRMRAFLACLRSDTPAMLNPANIPTPLLVLCCVLRFMLHWPGVRILRRNELDAFLAQALSPKLYEPDQLQELKIDNLDPRGVQLAALFMSGVDMALFANDACGQPIPWEHCCPWMYFDGKLLQSKLIRANREKAQLIDLCDGQPELVTKVEKMRQSILEGLGFSRSPHPPLFLPPPPPHGMPFNAPTSSFCPPTPMMLPQGRGRAMPGIQGISTQGGKLEIAGTVVGQWAGARRRRGRGGYPLQVVSVGGPNSGRVRGVISTPVIKTFGRGGRYHTPAFQSQGAFLSKPAHAPGHDAVKEKKKTKPEEKSSSPAGCDNSTSENGLDEGEQEQLNDDKEKATVLIQPESAFSSDFKMCNTDPYLNALNDDDLEAAVLKKEV